jgi:hypothetical protein
MAKQDAMEAFKTQKSNAKGKKKKLCRLTAQQQVIFHAGQSDS